MKDEIKVKLDEMFKQVTIHKVHKPTDWVNSIVYMCKSNSKLWICLDPKNVLGLLTHKQEQIYSQTLMQKWILVC